MARDHYVAETYLKHFIGGDGKLYVYRKSDGKCFPCRPRDICHEWNGDTIKDFMSDPELLARYRKIFEPAWNPALSELQAGRISPSEKMAIAGYWANLLACNPAQRRIDLKTHGHHVLELMRSKDTLRSEHGQPDNKLKEIISALDTGTIRIETKPDAVRAMQALSLGYYAWKLYNTSWIIIRNETGINFLTSDNPVAFQDLGARWQPGLSRYLSITPTLCLHCKMLPSERDKEPSDFSKPPYGTISAREATRADVKAINKAVVQCAEDLVISPQKDSSIEALVRKYAKWQVDVEFAQGRQEDRILQSTRTRCRERS